MKFLGLNLALLLQPNPRWGAFFSDFYLHLRKLSLEPSLETVSLAASSTSWNVIVVLVGCSVFGNSVDTWKVDNVMRKVIWCRVDGFLAKIIRGATTAFILREFRVVAFDFAPLVIHINWVEEGLAEKPLAQQRGQACQRCCPGSRFSIHGGCG